jgi:hypothetical protein
MVASAFDTITDSQISDHVPEQGKQIEELVIHPITLTRNH